MNEPRQAYQKIAIILLVPLFIAWTTALLIPIPGEITEKLGQSGSFYFAKSLHVGVFAFETLLGLVWANSYRERCWAAGFVSVQGIMTEIIQPYVGRHGCVQDVLIDHAGLTLGAVAFLALRAYCPCGQSARSEKVSGPRPV